jgi:hypothetical protein
MPGCAAAVRVALHGVEYIVQDDHDQLILETKAASEIKPEDVAQNNSIIARLLHLRDNNLNLI